MTSKETIIWSQLDPKTQEATLRRPATDDDQQLKQQVSAIIEQVKQQGDSALLSLTAEFDNIELAAIPLTTSQRQSLSAAAPTALKQAIDKAYQHIEIFHRAQRPSDLSIDTTSGVQCQLRHRPIEKIGLYIPGGSAPLISTVLMLGIPAQIAANPTRILCTPPNPDGLIHPAIAYAAEKCGIDQIFLSGGAQAIAAMAYGSESIPKVDKIFGPGNSYVTMAKQLVSDANHCVTIDMPAGPSEVLVLADAQANPEFIAADLLSQAEHGPDSQVVLVSDSATLIQQVKIATEAQLTQLPRQAIARASLQHALFICTDNLQSSIAVTNQYAPEHLIIQTAQAEQVLEQCQHASSIFVGAYSPESAGDYASGTNHVLPTYGYSRVLSSLSLTDFYKRFTVQTLSYAGLAGIGSDIIALAEAEGLQAHANAVAIRLSPNQHHTRGAPQ